MPPDSRASEKRLHASTWLFWLYLVYFVDLVASFVK